MGLELKLGPMLGLGLGLQRDYLKHSRPSLTFVRCPVRWPVGCGDDERDAGVQAVDHHGGALLGLPSDCRSRLRFGTLLIRYD